MSVDEAKKRVARNPCASTAAVVSSITALLIYAATLLSLSLPLWAASLLTGFIVWAALAFSRGGLYGLWQFILYGRGDDES